MIDRSFHNWLLNLFRFYFQRYCGKCKKRDIHIWAFSSWEGNKYDDNTKFFYEYVKSNYKNIRCIWFTNNTDILNNLMQHGDEVYLIGTKKSKEMQLKAGVAFYTNGVDDFGKCPYIYGALIVSLWHGVGFKRIYGAEQFEKYNKALSYIRKIKNSLFYWTYRDITCTTSEYMKEKAVEQFYIKHKENIFITGQPRNDIFKRKIDKNKILTNNGIKNNKLIITFMPTWQSFNNCSEIRRVLKDLDENTSFNIFLKKRNFQFIVKLHYLSKCDDVYKNIILINDKVSTTSQELLSITDILITDYSSVFADYALLNRPIIFFKPNKIKYMSEKGQYDDYKRVCNVNLAKNKNELINILENIINKKYDYRKQNDIINFYCNSAETIDGLSSERVYKVVSKFVKII